MKYADGPTAEATVHVDAVPERVWELVSDIHLVASLSGEVQEVEWLDDVRFRGRSRHPAVGEWTTVSRVVERDAPRVFAWDVEDPANPTASWRFELVPVRGGTALRQWVRMGPGPSNLSGMIERRPDLEELLVARRLRMFQAGIESNLAAIKQRAESGRTTLRPPTPRES